MKQIQTSKAPAAIGPYTQAILDGDTLYTSGQIALNPETGVIEATDVTGQTRQVMANLKEVLAAAGTDFSHVIRTTCYLKDVTGDFAAFNDAYAEALGDAKPARSCVGVAGLPKDALVEVEMIAKLS